MRTTFVIYFDWIGYVIDSKLFFNFQYEPSPSFQALYTNMWIFKISRTLPLTRFSASHIYHTSYSHSKYGEKNQKLTVCSKCKRLHPHMQNTYLRDYNTCGKYKITNLSIPLHRQFSRIKKAYVHSLWCYHLWITVILCCIKEAPIRVVFYDHVARFQAISHI